MHPFLVRFILVLLPLTSAALVCGYVVAPYTDARRLDVVMRVVNADTPDAAQALFAVHGYSWPPGETLPRLAFSRLPHELVNLTAQDRKALFFRVVLPLIVAENMRVERERAEVEQLLAAGDVRPGSRASRRLSQLGHRYRIEGEPGDPQWQKLLLRRIDAVPPALALAQSANESAWGTSRFALGGNALFGQWTWWHAGLVPSRRNAEQRHLVRSYPDLRASVRAYIHNLNTGFAYEEFREQREAFRAKGEPLDSWILAGALTRYSERGEDYVKELRAMIRVNGLDTIASPQLVPLAGSSIQHAERSEAPAK